MFKIFVTSIAGDSSINLIKYAYYAALAAPT